MAMMNRRNAMLGWAVWNVGKRLAKKKAKSALPGTIDDTRRPNASAIALIVAAVVGVLWFLREHEGDSPEPPA